MILYVWFVIAGAFAGVSAGLFGVGGGMIIVPALVWIFTAYDFSPEVVTHLAIGTSLATIVVTSISSLTAHNKRGGVRWEVWRKMALGLVVGSLVGAGIADMIDGQALQAIIGVGALLVALKMLFFSNKEQVGKPLPPAGVQFGAGTGIGMASSIFGIGGGSWPCVELGGAADEAIGQDVGGVRSAYCSGWRGWICLVWSRCGQSA